MADGIEERLNEIERYLDAPIVTFDFAQLVRDMHFVVSALRSSIDRVEDLTHELDIAEGDAKLMTGLHADAVAALRSSREENARLAKDAARLDWLGDRSFVAYRDRAEFDRHGRAVGKLANHVTVVDEDQRVRGRYGCVQATLRESIDEAMANAASSVSEEKTA